MKLIQSLDTTLIRNVELSNGLLNKINYYHLILRMAVLSHLRLLKFYPEKEIEFYVDDVVFEDLKNIFPKTLYKLSDIIPINSTHVWTQSKLAVIKHIKVPFLHIDCDIILKKHINLDVALFYDIFVERKEDYYTFDWYKGGINYIDDMFSYFKNNAIDYHSVDKYWKKDLTFAYNCGIIGFKSIRQKNKYIEFYEQLENIYTHGLHIKAHYDQIFVVLEQYSLNCFAQKESLSVGCLLPFDNLKEQGDFANNIGYVHLFGIGKFLPSNVKKISSLLKDEYIEIYNRLLTMEK